MKKTEYNVLNKYIDEVTNLVTDIDLRFRLREIVINVYFDGRAEGLNETKEFIDSLKKDLKL